MSDPSQKSSKSTLGIIFLTIFVDLVGFSIIFPLFPAMLEHYQAIEGQQSVLGWFILFLHGLVEHTGDKASFYTSVLFGGTLGTLYSLLQFVFAPIWGRLSDIHGRRKILLITTTGTALSYLLWIFAGSFWLLILARLLGGLMAGNISVATAAVADVTTRDNRSKGMALVGIAFGLGFFFGPPLGGFASLVTLGEVNHSPAPLALNPFSFPALVALCFALFNVVWVWRKFPETHLTHLKAKEERVRFSFGKLLTLHSPQLRRTILVYFIFILAFSGMEFTLTFLALERFQFTSFQNGNMFLFIGFVLIMVQGGIVRRYASKLGEKPLALAGFVSAFAAFTGLAFDSTVAFFFVSLFFVALGAGLVTPTLTALTSLYSTERDQGRDLGLFRSAGSLARAIGPISSALLYWALGSSISYLVGAMAMLVPLTLLAPLKSPRKDQA